MPRAPDQHVIAAEGAHDDAASGHDARDSAVRLPWTRGTTRFERRWLVLGPVAADVAASGDFVARLAARPPAPGSEVHRPGGVASAFSWRALQSWGDIVDLSHVFEPSRETGAECARAVFAHLSITRLRDGAADVLLGSDSAVTVWLNGLVVHERPALVGFAPDRHRFAASFRAGKNHVLVKLHEHEGSCRLALRVVESESIAPPVDEIAPGVVGDSESHLAVCTDILATHGAAVRVAVLAPGGRAVAEVSAARGEIVRFDGSSWPEGPYDLRCTTSSAWRKRHVVFLPWFKGDVVAAARRALAQPLRACRDVARGLVQRMLVDKIRSRLRAHGDAAVVVARAQLQPALMELAEIQLESSGVVARLRANGFVRLAWTDEIDDSPQFCRSYLPPDYDATRPWPVLFFLGGLHPDNPEYADWWSADVRHHPLAARHGVILLQPHGRGNSQYIGLGEADVLRSLQEARQAFNVDDERIYLMGESMGGSGTWRIGGRHPELFAALAPIFGGSDARVARSVGSAPILYSGDSPLEAFAAEAASSFASIESLNDVPVFVHHGDADLTASVENSRHVVRMLQRWGYDVRYRELPGRGHEDPGVHDEIVSWMLRHQRCEAPRRVRIRAADLLGASAHWLRVEAFAEPGRMIVADAEFLRPELLRLDTDNVTTVVLTPPPSLCGGDALLRVVWNGKPHTARSSDGRVTLFLDGCEKRESGEPARKRPGVEGPISDIIRTPFMVVTGTTSADPMMRRRCREKAEAFRELWRDWQHHEPRHLEDTAVSPADERRYSLLLIGGPDANDVTRRLAGELPLTIGKDEVVIDGREWAVRDALVQMIHPSPWNGNRYVMVVAGTSADGLYFWDPRLWSLPHGYPVTPWDWSIQDGRRVTLRRKHAITDSFIASGVFDASWRRDDRWTTSGNPTLRESAPLRRVPPPGGVAIPPEVLDSYCGQYKSGFGRCAIVTRQGDRLELFLAQGKPLSLVAEGETEFADSLTASPVVFGLGGNGIPRTVTVLDAGDQTVFRRSPGVP